MLPWRALTSHTFYNTYESRAFPILQPTVLLLAVSCKLLTDAKKYCRSFSCHFTPVRSNTVQVTPPLPPPPNHHPNATYVL
jgi:hypothetical protein